MIADVARIQEDEAGDGTTTAVAFAGELLEEASDLLKQDLHPSSIAKGFHMAHSWARDGMDEIAQPVDINDTGLLRNVARTSMTGKSAEQHAEHLADLIVEAVTRVAETTDGDCLVDVDRIEIENQPGRLVTESELLEGVVASKDPLHPDMTTTVEDANILLLYKELEVDTGGVETATLTDPTNRIEQIETEEAQIERKVDRIVDLGADVVFLMRGADDHAKNLLAKEGVLGINRIKKSDLENMTQVLDGSASPIWDLQAATEDDIGRGTLVHDERVEQFYVTGADPSRVTILVRGSTEQMADEIERSITDAIHAVSQTLSDERVLPGGGATEVELARRIRAKKDSVAGREQLGVEAFTSALEVVPRLLARNAGLDPIDVLTELRTTHDAGGAAAGLNVHKNEVVDAFDAGIIESLHAKQTGFISATEVATLILNIDDAISSGDLTTEAEVDEEDLGGPEFDCDTADMGGMVDSGDWMGK
jgi:chaperonin GroEL (HSP60 family)